MVQATTPCMARANGDSSEPRRRKMGSTNRTTPCTSTASLSLIGVYARTKSECRRKLCETTAARDSGLAVDPKNLTVKRYLEDWLEHSVKGDGRDPHLRRLRVSRM